MQVAMIGAGVVGSAMGHRLLAQGYDVSVFDTNAAASEQLVKDGARSASSAADATRTSEYVVTSLPRSEDVRKAFNDGAAGIIAGLRPGTVIVETSTVPPEVLRDLAPAIEDKRCFLVDAPLTSSIREHLRRPMLPVEGEANLIRQNATAGNLCFFVGGDVTAVEKAQPLLQVLGVENHHLGPLGAGKVGKLVHNGINITEVAILSEMLVLALGAGIELEKLVDVLIGTTNDSVMLRNHIARYTVPGHFPRGLFPLKYGAKDMEYVVATAKDYEVECSVASAVHELYERASHTSYAEYYHPVIFRYIQELSATTRAGQDAALPS